MGASTFVCTGLNQHVGLGFIENFTEHKQIERALLNQGRPSTAYCYRWPRRCGEPLYRTATTLSGRECHQWRATPPTISPAVRQKTHLRIFHHDRVRLHREDLAALLANGHWILIEVEPRQFSVAITLQ